MFASHNILITSATVLYFTLQDLNEMDLEDHENSTE